MSNGKKRIKGWITENMSLHNYWIHKIYGLEDLKVEYSFDPTEI